MIQLRWTAYEAAVACDRIPHQDLAAALAKVVPSGEEHAAVAAAAEGSDAVVALAAAFDAVEPHGEALGRDEVRRIQDRPEGEVSTVEVQEHADDGGLPVVGAEAAQELGIGDEVAPLLGDEGGAGERGRLRREADEYLGEEVFIVRRGRLRRRRQRGAAAADGVHLVSHVDAA